MRIVFASRFVDFVAPIFWLSLALTARADRSEGKWRLALLCCGFNSSFFFRLYFVAICSRRSAQLSGAFLRRLTCEKTFPLWISCGFFSSIPLRFLRFMCVSFGSVIEHCSCCSANVTVYDAKDDERFAGWTDISFRSELLSSSLEPELNINYNNLILIGVICSAGISQQWLQ